MTKKKQKKGQKAEKPNQAAEQKEKEDDDLDMLEDIKRDEDLYISESDVSNISNFIRTTNKSFNSLGNTVVEKFSNRCSLAILHALVALFDLDSTDREDVIRRLNIIYIVWRLPDCEPQLRLKPNKTMSDVYCHPYSTFLFYAEQLEKHPVEACLARIIVTNNSQVIEKLTAPDFIQKAMSMNLYSVDMESWIKWQEANTDHWPEITEEMVSLSKAMRELGTFRERKDHEAGMAEAFYPLVHNAPTMLPPRMVPLSQEDPVILKYLKEREAKDREEAATVIYSMSAGPDIQDRLKDAFQELTQTVANYQTEIDKGLSEAELEESRREIILDGDMSESSESEVPESEDSDTETEAEAKFREMTEKEIELDERVVDGCMRRILDNTALTSGKQDVAVHFIRKCAPDHERWIQLVERSSDDDNISTWCRTNPKFAAEFMSRHALSDDDDVTLFKRYLTLVANFTSMLPAFEFVVKISLDFKEHKKLTQNHRECVLNFVKLQLDRVEESNHITARSVRLVAMFIQKLLTNDIVTADSIASFVKPFCLKFTENRDCTTLYQLISDIQAGKTPAPSEEMTSSSSKTTTTGNPSMMTTTTTTTSVNTNATSTTTTTTVIKQCGPAVIKQTSKKVVLSGSAIHMKFKATAIKAFGAMSSATSQFLRQKLASSSSEGGTTRISIEPGTTTCIHITDADEELVLSDEEEGKVEEVDDGLEEEDEEDVFESEGITRKDPKEEDPKEKDPSAPSTSSS